LCLGLSIFNSPSPSLIKNIGLSASICSLIIEKAYALIASHPNKKKITIPELKKTISSTEISSKEAEEVLLNAGWEIFKSGTCPTKFFRPKY
jgi:hypothetical protein